MAEDNGDFEFLPPSRWYRISTARAGTRMDRIHVLEYRPPCPHQRNNNTLIINYLTW